MLQHYYVNDNAQENGDHEVHVYGCTFLDLAESVSKLGQHDGCITAVTEAMKLYSQSNGCFYCCKTCHTS